MIQKGAATKVAAPFQVEINGFVCYTIMRIKNLSVSHIGGLKMGKQKTGFWKKYPLLKAITVLVVFYLIHYCTEVPILGSLVYVFDLYYYFGGGLFILGVLYGIWLDRGCNLKFFSFCLVFLILTILLAYFIFRNVYPDWKLNGYIVWESMRSALFFSFAQMFSVLGGYILSKVISYFVGKYRKTKGITD